MADSNGKSLTKVLEELSGIKSDIGYLKENLDKQGKRIKQIRQSMDDYGQGLTILKTKFQEHEKTHQEAAEWNKWFVGIMIGGASLISSLLSTWIFGGV